MPAHLDNEEKKESHSRRVVVGLRELEAGGERVVERALDGRERHVPRVAHDRPALREVEAGPRAAGARAGGGGRVAGGLLEELLVLAALARRARLVEVVRCERAGSTRSE